MKPLRFIDIALLSGGAIASLIGVVVVVVPSHISHKYSCSMYDFTAPRIHCLELVVEMYAEDHEGKIPHGTEKDVFKLLTEPPNMLQPYLEKPLTDGWGHLLKYEYPTDKRTDGKPAIWSVGDDGISGTTDDITNWEDIIP